MSDIPRPGGPYAGEIIGSHWPGTSESALFQRAEWALAEAAAMEALVPAITAAWAAYRAAADAHMFEDPAQAMLRAAHMVDERAAQFRAMAAMFDQMGHMVQGVKTGITAVVVDAQAKIAAAKAAGSAQMAAAAATPGASAAIAAQTEATVRAIVDGAKAEVAGIDGLAAGGAALPKLGPIGPGGVTGPGGPLPPPGREGMNTPPPLAAPLPGPRADQASEAQHAPPTVFDQVQRPGAGDPHVQAPDAPHGGEAAPRPVGDSPGGLQQGPGPNGGPGAGSVSPDSGMMPDGRGLGPGGDRGVDIGGGRNAPDGGGGLFGEGPGGGRSGDPIGDGGGRVEPLPWLGNGAGNGSSSSAPPAAFSPGPQASPGGPVAPVSPVSPVSPAAPGGPSVTSPAAPAAVSTTPGVAAPAAAPAAAVGQQVSASAQAPSGGPTPSATATASAEVTTTAGGQNNMRTVAAAAFAAQVPVDMVLGALGPDANLALAETVVSALLAASPPVLGLEWAASVVSAGTNQVVLVTSNEGRGWIPPRVQLPRDVESPWLFGESLGAWELVNDAGRVLVEHAHTNVDKYQLLALASTRAVSSTMRSRFPDVRFSTVTRADDALDLGPKGGNTVDRLSVGVPEMSSRINAVAESAVAMESLGLVWDANERLGWVSPMSLPGTQVTAGSVREQILSAMNQERDRGFAAVSDHLWRKLSELDGLARSTCLSVALNADGIPVGGLVDDPASILRAATAERRVNEMVLLLNGRPSRARLRHLYFAYDQVLLSQRASVVSA